MARLRPLLVLVACVVLLAGCSGGPEAETTTTPPTDVEPTTDSTSSTTTEPTTVGTPATQTTVPTLSDSTNGTDPPDPRVVATNFEHTPSVDEIYRRVETLRGLTAREQVNVSVHGINLVNPETNERMEIGDPFDYPDDAAGMDESQTKALQLFSSRPVPLKGTAAAGMARGTVVNVANESAYEGIAEDSFDILLVHEFAHTLQSQHGLLTYERPTETTDGDLARMMLSEGDATLTAYQYWQAYDAGGADPLALRNTTTARGAWTHGFFDKTRYYGARYLQAMPSEQRDAHVRHPPDTTAEVMHPNLTWDLPGPPVTAAAPADWTTDSRNRVGELTIRYTLRTNGISYTRAAAASTGWWNDSMRTFHRPEGIATSWATRWADAQEAEAFATTWRAMLGNLNATRDDGVYRVPGTEHTPELYYVVVRDGPVVRIAAASTPADARAIATASEPSTTTHTQAGRIHISESATRPAATARSGTAYSESASVAHSTVGVPSHATTSTAARRPKSSDPVSADSDGDGIADVVERTRIAGHHPWVVLPELHPTEKDVIVDVVYAPSVEAHERLTDQEVANLRSTWRSFPVTNPGNSSGVHLHVRTHNSTALEGAFGSDFNSDAVDAFYAERYGTPAGEGVVNMVVVSEFDVGTSEVVGFGSTGGTVAVVRASEARPIVITHELLHLVLGPIHGERDCDIANNSSHTCEGYLAPDGDAQPFVTELLRQALNRSWWTPNGTSAGNRSMQGPISLS